MDHAARPKTGAGRERASLQGKDLEVKAEALPQNTEQRMLGRLTELAERMARLGRHKWQGPADGQGVQCVRVGNRPGANH
ncbi:hypothetical protein CCR75_007174 [Bremia lactucae]|uniref:Uncharacterized protein n=1 Tax=Bremia lactucae TaxID=4779 RepID=A0A976FQS2_BRELC|nr:hypothetical protein CCR75_007174 [Bremia lactucae]